ARHHPDPDRADRAGLSRPLPPRAGARPQRLKWQRSLAGGHDGDRVVQRRRRNRDITPPIAMRYQANGTKSWCETKRISQRTTIRAETKAATKPIAITRRPSPSSRAQFW